MERIDRVLKLNLLVLHTCLAGSPPEVVRRTGRQGLRDNMVV